MRCSRMHSCWDNRVTGKCQFKLKAVLKGDVYEVTEGSEQESRLLYNLH